MCLYNNNINDYDVRSIMKLIIRDEISRLGPRLHQIAFFRDLLSDLYYLYLLCYLTFEKIRHFILVLVSILTIYVRRLPRLKLYLQWGVQIVLHLTVSTCFLLDVAF